MLCSKCQQPLAENARFCFYCGAPAEAPVAESAEATPPAPSVTDGAYEAWTAATDEQVDRMPAEIAKPKKPIAWIVAVVAVCAVLLGVGIFFLYRTWSAGPLEGTWRVSMDFGRIASFAEAVDSEMVSEALQTQYGVTADIDFKELIEVLDVDVPLTVYLRFGKDEVDVILNVEEVGKAASAIYGNVITYLENGGWYDVCTLQGMSPQEADAALAQSGMTMDSLVAMLRLTHSQIKVELAKALEEYAFAVDGDNYTMYTAGYAYEDGKLELTEIPGVVLAIETDGDTLKLKPTALLQEEVIAAMDMLVSIDKAALPQ